MRPRRRWTCPAAPPAAAAPDADPAGPLNQEQREILDLLAGGHSIAAAARLRYLSLRTANRRVAEAREALAAARRDDDYIRHAVAELESFKPEPGEEAALDGERRFLMAGGKMRESGKLKPVGSRHGPCTRALSSRVAT